MVGGSNYSNAGAGGGRFVGPPVPSMTYIKWYVFLLLVRHPLIISPPAGLEKIARWRMYNGVELAEGLTCSIYCHANLNEKEALPRPDSESISVFYSDESSQPDSDAVVYSVAIKLHYNYPVKGNRPSDGQMLRVPVEAALHPREWLHTSDATHEVELWTNPPMDLFGHYMGLIRLALLDPVGKDAVDGPKFNIEVLYENHKDKAWEREANFIYQESEMLVQVETDISKGWRDRWNCTPTSIRLYMGEHPDAQARPHRE